MKKMLLFSLLAFSISGWSADVSNINNCQKWNPADWDRYISSNLLNELSNVNLWSPWHDISQNYLSVKKMCSNRIEQLGIADCFSRIEGYGKQFGANSKGQMFSAIMSDKDYYKMQPEEVMKLPPELANATNGLPKNWKKLAKEKGWQWVLFHSDTALEPRLIIRMPGDKFDRLLVYYTFDYKNTDPTTYQGLQMQAIEKKPTGGRLPQYYFRSWGFTGRNNHPQRAVSGGRCVSCHTSGPRAIVPLPESESNFSPQMGGVKSIDAFNKLIVENRRLDYSPYYDLKNFPSDMDLGASSQCTECHGGKDRNSLSFSVTRGGNLETGNFHRKVIKEKTMPVDPWWSWSDGERQRFPAALQAEHAKKLTSWLTENKCSNIKPKPLESTTGYPEEVSQ